MADLPNSGLDSRKLLSNLRCRVRVPWQIQFGTGEDSHSGGAPETVAPPDNLYRLSRCNQRGCAVVTGVVAVIPKLQHSIRCEDLREDLPPTTGMTRLDHLVDPRGREQPNEAVSVHDRQRVYAFRTHPTKRE